MSPVGVREQETMDNSKSNPENPSRDRVYNAVRPEDHNEAMYRKLENARHADRGGPTDQEFVAAQVYALLEGICPGASETIGVRVSDDGSRIVVRDGRCPTASEVWWEVPADRLLALLASVYAGGLRGEAATAVIVAWCTLHAHDCGAGASTARVTDIVGPLLGL